MAIMSIAPRLIDVRQFAEIATKRRTITCIDLPANSRFHEYDCSSDELPLARLFPAWFTNPERTEERAFDATDATPIAYENLLTLEWLRERKLVELRTKLSKHMIDWNDVPRELVLSHCSSCDHYVVNDGCKRLLRLAHLRERAVLSVVEIECRNWSRARADMRLVCACGRE